MDLTPHASHRPSHTSLLVRSVLLAGWQALNYALSSGANDTAGWIDIGGASTQITYVATHPRVLEHGYPNTPLNPSAIPAKPMKQLFSRSYMRHGQDQARWMMHLMLKAADPFGAGQSGGV